METHKTNVNNTCPCHECKENTSTEQNKFTKIQENKDLYGLVWTDFQVDKQKLNKE